MTTIYLIGICLTLLTFAWAAGHSARLVEFPVSTSFIVIALAVVWPVSWITIITMMIIKAASKTQKEGKA